MSEEQIHKIAEQIIAYKGTGGSYTVLMGQLMFTDYNIRISYRDYLSYIEKLQALDIENKPVNLSVSMGALTEAKFFFEAIYWFVLALEKVAKQKTTDDFMKAFKEIFKKYEYLKLPRVNISKDNFSKLIKAEGSGDNKTIQALSGDPKLMFQFGIDGTGFIKFQKEEYDPHKYFRDYKKLLVDLSEGLSKINRGAK